MLLLRAAEDAPTSTAVLLTAMSGDKEGMERGGGAKLEREAKEEVRGR